MEEMFKAITSPAWWVGVVIVGILINLAAAYLKPRIDEAAASVSLRWATRTEEQRRQRLRRIERLKGNVNEQLFASFDGLYIGLVTIALLIFSSTLLMSAYLVQHIYGMSANDMPILSVIRNIMSSLALFLAIKCMLDFARIISEIREARQSEDRHDQACS
jgi:hypothetical protein